MTSTNRLPALAFAVILGCASAAALLATSDSAHAQATPPATAPGQAAPDAAKPATPTPPPGAGQGPTTEKEVRGSTSPVISPTQPLRMPSTSRPVFCARRTTARMTAFKPGQSPPPVKTPMRMSAILPGGGRQRSPDPVNTA